MIKPFTSYEDSMGNWLLVESREDGYAYRHHYTEKLTCIISDAKELDNKIWRHISLAHRNRLPTYDEIFHAKIVFAGEDTFGIMPFVPIKKHINIHKNCLHIWIPHDHNPLPDFSRGSGSI